MSLCLPQPAVRQLTPILKFWKAACSTNQTALVRVQYASPVEEAATAEENTAEEVDDSEPTDIVWAFRLENGQWRYNWDNLIDFRTLSARSQTTGGVSMLPKEILRFSRPHAG